MTEPKKPHPMVGMLDAGYVQKDKVNKFHKYAYASDEAVSKKFRDSMRDNGIYVASSEIVKCELNEKQLGDATVQSAFVHIRFVFSDGTSTYGPYEGCGGAMDKGDKAVMKAMTAARKYAISQAALVSWGDDPEGDASIDELANKVQPPPKELSDAAKKILVAAQAAASEGLDGVKAVWKMASKEVKNELSGTKQWDDVKALAESHEKETQKTA